MNQKKRGKSRTKGKHRKPETIYSLEEANDRLADIFRNHEFGDFPHKERMELARFYRLLMENQVHENFTRLTRLRDVAIKHFIDSLIVPRLTELKFPLLDIGTGPGFPGIPLKILYPTERVVLAEGVRRRVDFLKKVRDEMGLENLDVIGRKIDKEFALPMAGVITRALADLNQTLEDVSQCLNIGGRVFFMKGPNVDEELEKAHKDWSEFYQLVEDHAYELPKTPHQRRLIVYEKIKTPELG